MPTAIRLMTATTVMRAMMTASFSCLGAGRLVLMYNHEARRPADQATMLARAQTFLLLHRIHEWSHELCLL